MMTVLSRPASRRTPANLRLLAPIARRTLSVCAQVEHARFPGFDMVDEPRQGGSGPRVGRRASRLEPVVGASRPLGRSRAARERAVAFCAGHDSKDVEDARVRP